MLIAPHSAVNVEYFASNEASAIASEESNGGGHVLGLAHSSDGNECFQRTSGKFVVSGDATGPGATAFTVIPSAASSLAR